MSYDFQNVEKKWSSYWISHKTYACDTSDFSKPKYYVLDMFPYPSGQGLHDLSVAIKKAFNVKPLIVDKTLKTKLPLKIDNPNELGSDLLCGAIGAINKYKYPLVVADLGTATKMYIIDKNGNYIGGMISSGMRINLEALVNNTAQLLETPIEAPKHVHNAGRLLARVENAFIQTHIEADREYDIMNCDDSYTRTYRDFMERFKTTNKEYIIAYRDSIAAAVLNAATDSGLRVPDNIEVLSIIGTKYSNIIRPQISNMQWIN